jgi:hypothetical protein
MNEGEMKGCKGKKGIYKLRKNGWQKKLRKTLFSLRVLILRLR